MRGNDTTSPRGPIRHLLRVPVPWVFVLAYLLGAGLERVVPSDLADGLRFELGIAGTLIFVVGAVIAGWPLWLFYRAQTTTVPGEESAELVTRGPYRFTRNPMYVGLSLAYLGEAGLLGQAWPLLFLPLVWAYLDRVVIPVEEARLRAKFGETYERYVARVRRWL